jgi:hypothetical protein
VGVVGLLIVVLITVNTLSTKSNGAAGIARGQLAPPFAVPLALGRLNGDADVATRADEGSAGRVPACQLRSAQILNLCALYERGPVVLALFVAGGSCPDVVDDLQRLAPAFAGLQFAAVAVRGSRSGLRTLVRRRGWTIPVGFDRDGVLANLYKVSTCPQVSFVGRGGRVAEAALLTRPPLATLRARLAALAQAPSPAPAARR